MRTLGSVIRAWLLKQLDGVPVEVVKRPVEDPVDMLPEPVKSEDIVITAAPVPAAEPEPARKILTAREVVAEAKKHKDFTVQSLEEVF